MKQTPMTRRLGEQLREKLGYILLFEISDPRPELAFKIDRSTDEAEAISRALENVPATLSVEKDEFGYPLVPDEQAQEEGVDEQ